MNYAKEDNRLFFARFVWPNLRHFLQFLNWYVKFHPVLALEFFDFPLKKTIFIMPQSVSR